LVSSLGEGLKFGFPGIPVTIVVVLVLSQSVSPARFATTFLINTVTFNFFVLHRPEFDIAISKTVWLSLMHRGIHESNELLTIVFPFPTTRLSCLFDGQVAFYSNAHYYCESDTKRTIFRQIA